MEGRGQIQSVPNHDYCVHLKIQQSTQSLSNGLSLIRLSLSLEVCQVIHDRRSEPFFVRDGPLCFWRG